MAYINYTEKKMAIKIVYYGPGLSGKTTNLRFIYSKMDSDSRGDLICLETATERTYFFDLLPIKAGLIHDFNIHFMLMTVPGQVFYDASRKNVLKRADGIVYVADSQVPLLDANLENFDGLRRNLLENKTDLNKIPLVFQYNKRDLENLIPVETFNNLFNPNKRPFIEAVAVNGVGVFESLKEIAMQVVPVVRERVFGKKGKLGAKGGEGKVEFDKERDKETSKLDFDSERETAPVRLTKVRLKSHLDVEKEIEGLAREYIGESKK